MKKTLALVLAFALVFSTMTMAFAEDAAIGADATVCKDLGMLVGDGSGVTTAYLATSPNRMTAAVMFLRLKGLEAEAKAFTATDNFADADKAAWAKPIMAYLKAHPELGWVGDGKNFDPTGAMTAQGYYKVMLEALGYKQTTATVQGDFSWDNVITFAGEKGLTKVATVANFTVNDIAVATVEALKANVKDTTKALSAALVEAGKLDKAVVEKAGLPTGAAAVTAAEVDAVRATANDKVEVTFTADVDKTFAENVANYKVVVKGSTTALEVKSAALSNPTTVVLTTAAQTGGTAYTMTLNNAAYNFSGAAKSTAALELDKVACVDTNTVQVTFKSAVDRASAEDVANYTLNNGATVKKAEVWVSFDDSRKIVKLTTDGVANNKVYQLKIANVKSADLVAIKSVTKSFTGKADTKAPVLYTTTVSNNHRLKLVFTDDHGVDKASAEKIDNYSITSGSDTLKIESIEAKDVDLDDYGYLEVVEIETDSMTTGGSYKLTINNLVDGSVAANMISKPITKDFKGVAIDKTAPKLNTATPLSDDRVELVFSDTNRLDNATLTDINNYTFDKDITVTAASIVRTADLDATLAKTVILETTAMEKNKAYKLTATNVADEFGNVLTTTTRTIVGIDEDTSPAKVTETKFVDENTVQVWFDERLDSATANDPANYSISGGIGTVTKASLSGTRDYKRVTLTVPTMTANKAYTLTINNVKDRVGNAMADVKAYFVATRTSVDNEKPEIASMDVISKNEVRVTFTEALDATAAAGARMTVSYTGSTVNTDQLEAVGQLLDDQTTVVFRTLDTSNASTQWDLASKEYTVTLLTGIKDKSNNSFVLPSDAPVFYGTTSDNVRAEVSTIEQVDARTIRVVFTKPVMNIGGTAAFTEGTNNTPRVFGVAVDYNGDNTTEAESTVDFTIQGLVKMAYDADYKVDFTSEICDYMGAGVIDDTDTANTVDTTHKTTFRSYIEDKDGPVIDYIEAVNTNTIKVVYNEDIRNDQESDLGTYKILNEAGTQYATSTSHRRDADVYNTVYFTTSVALVKDASYTLKPVVGAKDIADNTAKVTDIEFPFVGSSVTVQDYIKGVSITNPTKIRVRMTTDFQAANVPASVKVEEMSDDSSSATVVKNIYLSHAIVEDAAVVNTHEFGEDWSYADVTLKEALKASTNYMVTVNLAVGGPLTYRFNGLVDNGGIIFNGSTNDTVTFSGWNLTDYVVKVVYVDGANVYEGYTATAAPDQELVSGITYIDLTALLAGGRLTNVVGGAPFAPAVPAGAAITVEVHRYDATSTTTEGAALYTITTTR